METMTWSKEMPKISGWYWVLTDLYVGAGEQKIYPCYYDAKWNEMQSIEDGIACEIFGVLAVSPMEFPTHPTGI